MSKSEYIQGMITEKLKEGMYNGNMHACLRDNGRLAGGYHASNVIDTPVIIALETIAMSLANNPDLARGTWNEAVQYGFKEPVEWTDSSEFVQQKEHRELDWDDEIGGQVIDKHWLQVKRVPPPAKNWDGITDLIRYLNVIFESEDKVCYVTETFWHEDKQKMLPSRGAYDRTAKELITALSKTSDITDVVGNWNEEQGGWIRFNPLDGEGVYDSNVADFRHALVECDDMPLDEQYSIYKELELPVTALVHSAGKSIHAIVKIDADSKDEFKKRVDYLYEVCGKNGLKIDRQNRNPSRLSRLPGITRNGKPQYILDTNIGKASYNEWYEWIEDRNDDLPEFENFAEIRKNLPPLAPELIQGVLRQGHKMLIAGASKAGKSFDLIELCIAIAEGGFWHGWRCTKGKVLYINLELDDASCKHRFNNIYNALGIPGDNSHNVEMWNLRGKSKTMDKLAPKLIRRAAKKQYIAIVIDPIYKVITGDKNSADQMAHFCNQFDKICTELGCATIYCHHHSKGSQGQKRAADRSSGSGVFARDPDALIDLIELDITEDCRKQVYNKKHCRAIGEFLNIHLKGWQDKISQDDMVVAKNFHKAANSLLSNELIPVLANYMAKAYEEAERISAWRIEGTLREFPIFKPRNCWFEYPLHKSDADGILNDAEAEGEAPPWQKNKKEYTPEEKEAYKEEKQNKKDNSLLIAFENLSCNDEPVKVSAMQKELEKGLSTIKRWIDNNENLTRDKKGIVTKINEEKE